jgi:hypothetical protein
LEYKEQIRLLTENNAELARENAQCKLTIEALQKELEALQRSKSVELTQVASPAPSNGSPVDAPCSRDCSCQDIVDKVLCDRQNPASPTADTPTPAPIVQLPKRNRKPPEVQDLLGCGSCSAGGECKCYNAAVAAPSVPLPKRATSPISNSSKRNRTNDYLDDLEIDFTTAYMTRPVPSRGTPSNFMPDPCGFCSDGTPCVCAEMANAMDMEDSDSDSEGHDIKLAPLLGGGMGMGMGMGLGMLSPPSSSAGDAVPLRRMAGLDRPLPLHPAPSIRALPKASTGAGSGCKPGGCDQCKADPMSTLFCQSVATRIRSDSAPSSSSSGGCCGGNASGGGCCRDIESAVPPAPKRTTRSKSLKETSDGTYIPCSAAYQTLSRHRAFDEAAADLGALVRPLVIQSVDGRCPQVEVNSVRDVLKMLDRRFGRD